MIVITVLEDENQQAPIREGLKRLAAQSPAPSGVICAAPSYARGNFIKQAWTDPRILVVSGPMGAKLHIALCSPVYMDEDLIGVFLPGGHVPDGFVGRAKAAMEADVGLALYGTVGQKGAVPSTMDAKAVRVALRGGHPLAPGFFVVRRSILEQIDGFTRHCHTSAEVAIDTLARCAAWFRVRLEVSDGPEMTPMQIPTVAESSPFEELAEDYSAYGKQARQAALRENASMFKSMTQGINLDDGSEKSKNAVGAYYVQNDSYIEELAYWHIFRYWDGWWTLGRHAKGDFLEYGGGLGTMSFFVRDHVNAVDYFDINKEMINFVDFRNKRRGGKINILPVSSAPNYHQSITKEYDSICAIDVIEHIPNWQEVTRHLIAKLRPGGVFIQHTNFGRSETHPMHFNSDVQMPAWLEREGMRLVVDRFREFRGVVWEKP